jgi:hypothetical protein
VSTSDSDGRLESMVEVAIARVARGEAMFLPVTPTTTIASIAAAVRQCAARRKIDVAVVDRGDGVFVARQTESM